MNLHQLRSIIVGQRLFLSTLLRWALARIIRPFYILNSYVQGICTWCALARTRSSTCLDSLFPCPHLQDQILWSFCLILFTFAVWNSAVVPALSANVVGVLGARHIAPWPAVLLVWVPAEVVRPSPLAHLAVPPVAQVGFGPLLAGGSRQRD